MASEPNPNIRTVDFYSLLKRAKRLHKLINEAYPGDDEINLVTCLFTYLLFKSGIVKLSEILADVGNTHDIIMLQKGTGGLSTMLEEMKLEDGDFDEPTEH